LKTLDDIRAALEQHKRELHDRYHVKKIGIFGSYARREHQTAHDVDILVDLDQPVGWEIVDLYKYLEQLLGLKVDLVTRGAVARNPLLWQSIKEDLVYV